MIGGRASVGFDEIEDLSRNHRQHLRHEPESHLGQAAPARRAHSFRLLLVGRFNDLRKQLAERAEIRGGDRQHPGERAKADHVDPDQSPDQRVDATHGVKEALDREAQEGGRDHVARGQHAKRQGEDGPKQRA
jgi:hypothetical protein